MIVALFAAPGLAGAEPGDEPAAKTSTLADVVVTTSPLRGTAISADKVPANVQSLSASELAGHGSASVTAGMADRLASVDINDNLADAFQPDISCYATFGAFGDPTGIGVPGIPAGATINSAGVDTRFESPAAPIAIYGRAATQMLRLSESSLAALALCNLIRATAPRVPDAAWAQRTAA